MPHTIDIPAPARNLFGTPEPREFFAAISDPEGTAGRAVLQKVADKIGRHPPPRRQVGHPRRRDLSGAVRRARPGFPDPRRDAGPQSARPGVDLRRRAEARRLRLPGPLRGRFGAAPAANRPGAADADVAGLGRAARPAARVLPAYRHPARGHPVRGAGAEHLLRLQPAARAGAGALGADAQRRRRHAGRDPQRRGRRSRWRGGSIAASIAT